MFFSLPVDIRFIGCGASIVDLIIASTLRNDIVQIYSNSWGFIGQGDTVSTPGDFWTVALSEAVNVRANMQFMFCNSFCKSVLNTSMRA